MDGSESALCLIVHFGMFSGIKPESCTNKGLITWLLNLLREEG